MAGGTAVAAPRAVAVEAGPGLRAAAAVFTAAGRAPGSSKDRKDQSEFLKENRGCVNSEDCNVGFSSKVH